MKYLLIIIVFIISLCSNAQNTTTIEKKILFKHDQFLLTTNATLVLDSLIAVANKYSSYTIKIVGYTDPSGSLKYNQKLSYERAKQVNDYFIDKKLNQSMLSYNGFGIDNKSENETVQRNTTVIFTAKSEDCYYKLNTVTGKNGTEVSFNLKNEANSKFTLEEFFSTQSMIQNEKFALDIDDDVLETAGMIAIDLKNIDPNAIEDGTIQVAMPAISNAIYDEELTVWVEENNEDGSKRWRNLKLKPKWNTTAKRYEFSLNVSNFRGNKISLNLDKNIYREQVTKVATGKNKKVIIVATEREEFFYDVYLSASSEKQNDLKFSARMDKTGFAFVIPKNINPKKLYFTGINSSGKTTFGLLTCKVLKYNKKYPLYKQILVSSKDLQENEKTKNSGFWEWLKRIFNSSK